MPLLMTRRGQLNGLGMIKGIGRVGGLLAAPEPGVVLFLVKVLPVWQVHVRIVDVAAIYRRVGLRAVGAVHSIVKRLHLRQAVGI